MNRCTVEKVLIDPEGQLFLIPEIAPGRTYDFIYREANGLRWHKALRAIHAHEPERWEHVELLRHIAATLQSAFDEELHIVDSTTWEGVSPNLQAELKDSVYPTVMVRQRCE